MVSSFTHFLVVGANFWPTFMSALYLIPSVDYRIFPCKVYAEKSCEYTAV